jgi:hypothetical protein
MKKIFTGILLASLISCAPIFAQEDSSPSLSYVPNEVIVTYKANSLNNPKGLRSSSVISEESNRGQDISLIKTTEGQTVEQLIQDLQNDPNVESIQPNFRYHTFAISNDPNF